MENDLSLKNHNILVTGVSRSQGIGSAIVKRCAMAGANIVLHGYPGYDAKMGYPDATKNYIPELVNELISRGYNVAALKPSDLSDPTEPEKIIYAAQQIFGKLNGLILNHAYSVRSNIFDWTAEHIDNHFNINVRASMLLIQNFAKQVNKEKKGTITLFTSGQYLGPMISEIAYALSKEALRGLCSQAAVALAPLNIRVNCINPGPTDTGYMTGEAYDQIAAMFPSGKWGTPDDAAKLVNFLHSDYAQWITGQTITSEGGFQR
jgi:3-oxoacyl-[acyl-carrier protein] reductase